MLECRVPRFQSRNWGPFGDIYFLEDEQYDPSSGRIVTEYTFIRNGDIVSRQASHRCYTFRQISELLVTTGFRDLQAYGSLTGEPFRLGRKAAFWSRQPALTE